MSNVRSSGNVSTELRVLKTLRANHVTGWRRHLKDLPGKPDFCFPIYRLAVFVHGCFWHGCEVCDRKSKSRKKYWADKIAVNRRRDAKVRGALYRQGYHVMTVWEHELKYDKWLNRLLSLMERIMAND
jgi:DNA mismatch endonuclease (patch repair protein)